MNIKIMSFIKIIVVVLFVSCKGNSENESKLWPPKLPTANQNGMAILKTNDLLKMPVAVQHILDSMPNPLLSVAQIAPTIELTYFDQLPNAALNGTGWSSWGDLCIPSDGMVYSGIGNHGGIEQGEAYVYSWNPSTQKLQKVADINEITGAKPNEVHFSKVHAHIIEGKDKKIYFTGTLDDGGLAGSKHMLEKWTKNIRGGKLFQYDPATGRTIVYADFPDATVTTTLKYDSISNLLYSSLEGDPKGFAFGAFDMGKKEWVYKGHPGQITLDRNFILDARGNVYFNGNESFNQTGIRLIAQLEEWRKNKKAREEEGKLISSSMLPAVKKRISKYAKTYTTLYKYDPTTNEVVETNSYFTSGGFRSSTRESKGGYIYGSTMGGELFSYSPEKDEIEILGSNFLKDGEYITVCTLSPDENYFYYLPGAHGSAGFSRTPIIQYDIEKGKQKALAFLYEPMNKVFQYAPGGTYGLKISADGSKLYVGLNGSPSDSLRPKELHQGFGLTSFAVINIPIEERGGL